MKPKAWRISKDFSGTLATFGIDSLQPVQFGTQLLDAVIPYPGIRMDLSDLAVKGKNQLGRRFERAKGIISHKLPEDWCRALPVGAGRFAKGISQPKAEQHLIAQVSGGSKPKVVFVSTAGVIEIAGSESAIGLFECGNSRWWRRRKTWSVYGRPFIACAEQQKYAKPWSG